MTIKEPPEIKTVQLPFKDKIFNIEYFFRLGRREIIVFIHGLRGSKENYLEACKSESLAKHTLICFDNPGTGSSSYFDDLLLDVDDLTFITADFIKPRKPI